MKRIALLLVLSLAIAAIAIGTTYASRRQQMDARQRTVRDAWSQVDGALQSRAELVTPLLASVRAASGQERATFGDLQRARDAVRAAATPRDRIAANQQLDQATGRLMALVNTDPDLRFNSRFFRLQEELAIAQNRVLAARRHYDAALENYNALVAAHSAFARWSGHAPLTSYFAGIPAHTAAMNTPPGE